MAESAPTKKEELKNTQPELLSLDPYSLVPSESTAPAQEQPLRVTQGNYESIIFVWYDPHEQSSLNMVGPLRTINDQVQAFNDSTSCIKAIKFSKEKIFFVTSSSDSNLIAMIHNIPAVETIFILDPNAESIKGEFPKLCGIYPQQEELFRALKETMDIFEQIQLELFAFEHDKIFLWSQLWKQELTNRKISSKRQVFIEASRQYYRDNAIVIRSIDEFDKSYRSTEVISWFFRSPFPSRFLHHALRSQNKEQLSFCRPLFADAAKFFQQHSKSKLSDQYYRGMKLSSELVDKFEAHVGQLVCTGGFFPCTKSRTNALTLASLPAYRSDLLPVLFKIDCDPSAPCTELNNKSTSPMFVFDVYTSFRIAYINRDQIVVIKLKTAGEAGKQIAHEYIEQHKNETIQSLLDELTKPPTPAKPGTLPPLPTKQKPTANRKKEAVLSAEEIKAQRYINKGDIDRALATYKRIQPLTPHVLNAMGQLSAERKEDFVFAIECHKKALQMQEEAGEDTADTLTELGNAYHRCNQYDLASNCHTRALALRQSYETPDDAAVATNLMGLANTHWARQEYPEAIDYAQRALQIRENLVPPNNTSIAATLSMLGSIYQDWGNIPLAINLCKKALDLFQSTLPPDSSILADLHYNMGAMYLSTESLQDARQSFKNVVKIYRKILPEGHPDLTAAEEDLHRVTQSIHEKKKSS